MKTLLYSGSEALKNAATLSKTLDKNNVKLFITGRFDTSIKITNYMNKKCLVKISESITRRIRIFQEMAL